MSKPKRNQPKNYYQRAIDPFQTKLNLVEASKEKLGLQTEFEKGTWEVADSKDAQLEESIEEVKDSAFRVMVAPTKKPSRPRARKIAYNAFTKTLVIRFRDGAWIGYDNIEPEVWNGLKSSPSTNDFINESGEIGPGSTWYKFNPSDFPDETRVLFNA